MESELAFEVETPLGFHVRCTAAYWSQVLVLKHPVMAQQMEAVKLTLSDPDEIRQSKHDDGVLLFYRADAKRWVCAVARRLNGDGFLITTYPTNAIKEGVTIWSKFR